MPKEGLDLEITERSGHCCPCQSQNVIAIFVRNVTQRGAGFRNY